MPDFRYGSLDRFKASLRGLLERLSQIFHDVLLQTGGDVEEALRALDQWGRRRGIFDGKFTIDDLRRYLEHQRTVSRDAGGKLSLTPKGERALRREALEAIFGNLRADVAGEHRVSAAGEGTERLPETRAWKFGDPLSAIDPGGTVLEALRRSGTGDFTITEADLRVHETEHLSSCATVLLIDVSHSMILYGEDRITPAKRVALALTELIRTRYPKDQLHVVLFGDEAQLVPLDSLPYISVGPYHTNTRAGLLMAQDLLRKARGANRQIFMLTDGKPSVITERDGTVYRNPFGLDERIVNATLDQAAQCRRNRIPITTFMLTRDPVLVDFVETFTRINRGRAYVSRPDDLGSYVLVDYIRNRRRKL